AVYHAFFAGLVERDGELVAVDMRHIAVAELLMKDAVAGSEGGDRPGRFGNEFALDGERGAAFDRAARWSPLRRDGRIGLLEVIGVRFENDVRVVEAAARLACLRALPAGRRVVGTEALHRVEARAELLAEIAEAALRLGHLDIGLGQFVEEARGNGRRPASVDAPVRHEVDF